MVASGPFAMGPSMGGPSTRRGAPPRGNFAPAPALHNTGDGIGSGRADSSSGTKDRGYIRDSDMKPKDKKPSDEEEEMYSEPDEGVEIVDMDHVGRMDWMAPESLKREREGNKKAKKAIKVEVEKSLGRDGEFHGDDLH
jgi:DNA-directed RNA polymerase III subunit RPC4